MATKKDQRIHIQITADGKQYSAAIDKATGDLKTFGNEGKATAAKMSFLKRDINLLNLSLAGVGAGLVARELIQAGVAVQGFRAGLRAATGSQEAAAEALAFLRQETERIGLSFEGSAQSFTQLAAAAKGTALEGQGVRDIFIGVAEAARVMQLPAAQINGVMFALNQIMSKGVVSSEELRRQLGDRIPGAFQIAARAMGVSTAELQKMLETGTLISDDFLPKFARELRKTVAEGLPDATASAQAAFERMKNAVFDLKVSLAEGGFIDAVKSAANWIGLAARATRFWGEQMGFLDINVSKLSLGETQLQIQKTLRQIENTRRVMESLVEGSPARARQRKVFDELVERQLALRRQEAALLAKINAGPAPPSAPVAADPSKPSAEEQKLADSFAKAELALKRRIELIGKQTQVERVLFEVKFGAFKDFEPAQKKTLVDMAKEFDFRQRQIEQVEERRQALMDERQAERELRDELIEQEQAALDQRRDAAKQGLEIVRQSVSTELELADAKYAELHNKLVEAQRFERITIAEFNVLKQKLESEHLEEVQRITKRNFDATRDQGKETFRELSQAVKGWGRDFADVMVDNEKGFAGFVDGVIRELQRIAITTATDPLFGAFEKFLLQALTGAAGSGLGPQFTGTGTTGLQSSGSFAHGGEFEVGGSPGIDRTMVMFNATRGEKVKVSRAGEQSAGGGGNVTVIMENRGTPQRVSGSNVSFDAHGMVVRIIKEDIQRGGGVAGTLESTYGMRRLGG